MPATAFIPSNGVCTGPTPPLVGVPRGGRGPSTGTQQAANRGARVHTPRVPATKQRPGALAAAGALRRPYVGTGSHIKTRPGPPQAGRPVRSHHNRKVAPSGPPPAALNPTNQTPRAVPLQHRGPSLATAKGPHHAVREVDAMADSGQNRRFTALDIRAYSTSCPLSSSSDKCMSSFPTRMYDRDRQQTSISDRTTPAVPVLRARASLFVIRSGQTQKRRGRVEPHCARL